MERMSRQLWSQMLNYRAGIWPADLQPHGADRPEVRMGVQSEPHLALGQMGSLMLVGPAGSPELAPKGHFGCTQSRKPGQATSLSHVTPL